MDKSDVIVVNVFFTSMQVSVNLSYRIIVKVLDGDLPMDTQRDSLNVAREQVA